MTPSTSVDVNNQGLLEGYACVFRIKDHQKDVVLPHAFRATLNNWRTQGKWPKMLWQHDLNQPIGVWEDMREDQHGLYVRGRLLMELRQGREAYALLQAHALDGLSIGYRIIEARQPLSDAIDVKRYLCTLDLIEVSVVTLPANPQATVTHLKNTLGSVNLA